MIFSKVTTKACYLQRLFLTFCLLITLPASAETENSLQNSSLDVQSINKAINLLPFSSYFIDHSFQLKIDDMLNLDKLSWTKNNNSSQNFGQINAPVWFKFKIKNTQKHKEKLFISLEYPHHDLVSFYYTDKNNILKETHTGDRLPFKSRENSDTNFISAIPDSLEPLDIYISIRTEGLMKIPLYLVTQTQLNAQTKNFSFATGIYFGAITIMVIFNLFIWLTAKDENYSYYLLYIICSASFQSTLTGLSFQYFWPELPLFNQYAIIITAILMATSAVIFIQQFLGISYSTTKFDQIWINILIGFFILIALASIVVSYHFSLKMLLIGASVLVLTGFYVGLKYWLKGVKSARFFALAWFSYLFFVLLYLLDSKQIINSSAITEYYVAIGSLVELCLLSIAFADKLNSEKELRLKAQNELLESQITMNLELDSLVENRTIELEKANIQLKQLSVTDSLTQLKNRYYFDQTFKKEFSRAAREGWSFSVIMLDIDHFKSINDMFGHLFGDYCLEKSAALVQSIVHRPSDTVARYGGEEIAILLPNTTLDGALKLAEKIREHFRETEFINASISKYLTVSMGVSSGQPQPKNTANALKLIEIADQCLYKAKENGRDQVVGLKCSFEI